MADPKITNRKDGSCCEQLGADTILRAALRAGLGYSYECNSGGCGGCKFSLIDGEVETLWPDAPGLSPRDRARGRHLACQSRACGDITIEIASAEEYAPVIAPARHQARLTDVQDISHDIREFRFQADAPANFRPGQFAMLDLPGLSSPRAYSLSNLPNAAGEWHFQIRRVAGGAGTGVLFDRLTPGEVVGLDGPYGLAYLREEAPRDIICVAGGSGLAPMLSIARGAAAAGMLADRKLLFFYGGRTPADICCEALLAGLEAPAGSIEFHPVVSESADGDGWNGKRGFVHEAVKAAIERDPAAWEYYFAGPPPMTQALQDLLMIDLMVPFQQIHFDRFF